MNRGSSRATRAVTALVGLGLVGLQVSCTTEEPEPGPGAASSAGTSAATSAEPEPQPVDPYAVPTLPDGDLEVQAVVKGRITPAMEDISSQGQVLVTEDLLLLIPSDQKVRALDRETGDQLWTAPVRVDKRGYGACPQAAPPSGATAIVVFSGFRCGLMDTLSLEDGSRIDRTQVTGTLGPEVTDPTHVAGRLYYADAAGINEVSPDGSTDLVVATAQMGFKDDYQDVDQLTAIAGSDVLMARAGFSYPREGGTLLGFRPTEEGDLEEVWRRSTADVQGKGAMLDNTAVYPSFDGVLVDTVRKGIVTPRMLTVDPDTGRRDLTYVLQRDPPGGYPSWIENKFSEETLIDPRGSVFSAAGDGGFSYSPNVVRHDLVRNRVAWAWDPGFKPDTGVSGYPLAVSEDGEHVYVLWNEYSDFRLVELDYGTGKQQRVWRVPLEAAGTLTHATGVLAGNQLVLYAIYGSRYDESVGVVLRVGEA